MKGNMKWNKLRHRLVTKTRRSMTIVRVMGVQAGHLAVMAADTVKKKMYIRRDIRINAKNMKQIDTKLTKILFRKTEKNWNLKK